MRIRLEAADAFDEVLTDYDGSEIKLCVSMLDTLLTKSSRAYAFLEQRLNDARGAALAAAGIGPTGLKVVRPSLKDLGLLNPTEQSGSESRFQQSSNVIAVREV